MKTLVLAEKPSVARDLAKVLHCKKDGNGYMEGPKFIVTWALGHLVTLAEPEDYDSNYKTWKLEELPILPSKFKLVVIKESRRQFKIVREQMHRKDVKDIVIATDAGREGELVARWILEKAKVKKPLKRLWISSVTDKAIREGFKNLRDAREFEKLFASAEARAQADWLVGINATRALTCKYNAQLSCGRVQTPTLAMVAKREEEIQNFKPREYFGITASARDLVLTWQDGKTKSFRSFDSQRVDEILQALKGKNARVVKLDKVHKKSHAPKLYDLTELQRDANRIYGFSAKETLAIMQRLYERHKVLTYPRTDSRYISSDMVETLEERLKACGVGSYRSWAFKILKGPIKASKNFVDNSKVTDHHAIIPTEEPPMLSSLSDRERKIYDLVVKRFLAVLCPPVEYEDITLRANLGGENFIARGKVVLARGWKEIYEGDVKWESEVEDLKDQGLPKLKPGDIIEISKIEKTFGQTKAPALHTEATLLSAMENPTKYMPKNHQDLIKVIGKTGGLGTVATRADIIEKLFNSFLIEKRGEGIAITSKGRQLLELVPEELKSPVLTAEWEQKLSDIAQGTLKKADFVEEMKKFARAAVKEIKASEAKFVHDNLTRSRCPECGKYMLEVNGKKGKMLVCQDRECGHRTYLSRKTNARCPDCHKKMEIRGEGEGQIFICPCGFREKVSSFNERRKNQSGIVSKREVSRYLREQNKKETPLNPLADALSKLKL